MSRILCIAVLCVASATSACFGLECAIPGFCSDRVPGEGEGEGEGEGRQICDQDGACFACNDEDDNSFLEINPNGAGCDGEIVCDGVEFRIVCELNNGTEDCECQIDRDVQSTFQPTELCEASNVETRALNECGWTLE